MNPAFGIVTVMVITQQLLMMSMAQVLTLPFPHAVTHSGGWVWNNPDGYVVAILGITDESHGTISMNTCSAPTRQKCL